MSSNSVRCKKKSVYTLININNAALNIQSGLSLSVSPEQKLKLSVFEEIQLAKHVISQHLLFAGILNRQSISHLPSASLWVYSSWKSAFLDF